MAEFRIFFPVIDIVALESSLIDHPSLIQIRKLHSLYNDYTQQLDTFKLSELNESKIRTDRYICGSCNYGLKFRNGTRLELKVKQKQNDCDIPGLEYYCKEKLDKKLTLQHEKFTKKVKKVLKELGNVDDINDNLLDNTGNRLDNRCLDITKNRCNNNVSEWDTYLEYCIIKCSIPNGNDSGATTSTSTSEATTVPVQTHVHAHANWISIAMESNSYHFFNNIHVPINNTIYPGNAPLQTVILWKSLVLSMKLVECITSHPCGVAYYNICPIVGGYPSFVSYIVNTVLDMGNSTDSNTCSGSVARQFRLEMNKIIEKNPTVSVLSTLLSDIDVEIVNK